MNLDWEKQRHEEKCLKHPYDHKWCPHCGEPTSKLETHIKDTGTNTTTCERCGKQTPIKLAHRFSCSDRGIDAPIVVVLFFILSFIGFISFGPISLLVSIILWLLKYYFYSWNSI